MSFPARYRGTCDVCEATIAPGEQIEHYHGYTTHAACAEVDPPPSEPPCPYCWLIHAGECP